MAGSDAVIVVIIILVLYASVSLVNMSVKEVSLNNENISPTSDCLIELNLRTQALRKKNPTLAACSAAHMAVKDIESTGNSICPIKRSAESRDPYIYYIAHQCAS